MISRKIFLSLLGLLFLTQCEKVDNFNHISQNYQYKANFSFAIGSSFLDLPNVGINLPAGWENNPMLLALPDSLVLASDLHFYPDDWIEKANEKIASITIKVRGYNDFPDKARLTLSLSDSVNFSSFPDDSLTTIIIPEAQFTVDSVPEKKGYFETLINLSDKQIKNINNKRHLQLKTEIQNKTKHLSQYTYYPNFKIEIGVGVQVQFNFNLQTLNK